MLCCCDACAPLLSRHGTTSELVAVAQEVVNRRRIVLRSGMGRAVMPIEDVVDAQTDLTVLIRRIDRIPRCEQVRLRLIGRLFGRQLDALRQIGRGEVGRPLPTPIGDPACDLNPPEASFPAAILHGVLHLWRMGV